MATLLGLLISTMIHRRVLYGQRLLVSAIQYRTARITAWTAQRGPVYAAARHASVGQHITRA